jgi:hypothetical protein
MPDRVPALTPTTKTWVRITLSFTVSVAIGLAPLLGTLNVPLFAPLLSLLPKTVRTQAIVWSSTAMGLVAVIVQWNTGSRVNNVWLKKMFSRSIKSTVVAFVFLFVAFIFLVTRVEYEGGERSATFVTGFVRPSPDKLCGGMSSSACIQKKLSFNPAEIESYWGDAQIRGSELVLVFAYVGFLASVGCLIGLIVVRQSLRRPGGPPRAPTFVKKL